MWHASITCPTFPNWLFSDLPRPTRRRAVELGELLLRGVGTGETRRETIATAAHFRRRLSTAEIVAIDPSFLACPAIDGAGRGVPL